MYKDILLAIALILGVLIAAPALYVLAFSLWWRFFTRFDRYFGLPIARRRLFKARVRRYGRFVQPILNAGLHRLIPPQALDLTVSGLNFPKSACSRRSVETALAFEPDSGDVIVATQMKCGTTWMQQIVYEVLSRGKGNLEDDGHRHSQAVCAWLEAERGVPLDRAPRIGMQGARIIKTHLPASHCPWSPSAKYIYVTRHPVSCYLSMQEFTATNGGPLVRGGDAAVEWFCSDDMWWGAWPDHVAGWWQQAAARDNILFLHFEDLKADLDRGIRQVARFLAILLDEREIAAIARKCEYSYMKAREEWFEMSPPTPFSFGGSLFKSGSAQRDSDADAATRAQIVDFCRERLAGTSYPAARFYPELTDYWERAIPAQAAR